jgi:hypothetical protein
MLHDTAAANIESLMSITAWVWGAIFLTAVVGIPYAVADRWHARKH